MSEYQPVARKVGISGHTFTFGRIRRASSTVGPQYMSPSIQAVTKIKHPTQDRMFHLHMSTRAALRLEEHHE